MPVDVGAGSAVTLGFKYLALPQASQVTINELTGVNLMAVNAPAADGR